jgi:cytochrome c6
MPGLSCDSMGNIRNSTHTEKEKDCVRLMIFQLAVAGAAILSFTLAAAAQHTQSGSNTFQSTCAMCHGNDGGGSDVGKSLHVPDLRSATVQSHSNAELAHFISEGNGAMPAFKDRLSNQQILDEVHYIRSLAKHSQAK